MQDMEKAGRDATPATGPMPYVTREANDSTIAGQGKRDVVLRPGQEMHAGNAVGRDPREMPLVDLEELGHGKQPLLRVLRARCLDCCADQPNEVRWCTAVRCANWPYRMGSDPWRPEPSERQRRQVAALNARRHGTSPLQGPVSPENVQAADAPDEIDGGAGR